MKITLAILAVLALVSSSFAADKPADGPALLAPQPPAAGVDANDDSEVVVPRKVISPAMPPEVQSNDTTIAGDPRKLTSAPIYLKREGQWYRRLPSGKWYSWDGQAWQLLGRAKPSPVAAQSPVANDKQYLSGDPSQTMYMPRRGLFNFGRAQQPTNRGWVGGFYSSGGGYGSPGFGYGYGVPTYGPWQGR